MDLWGYAEVKLAPRRKDVKSCKTEGAREREREGGREILELIPFSPSCPPVQRNKWALFYLISQKVILETGELVVIKWLTKYFSTSNADLNALSLENLNT